MGLRTGEHTLPAAGLGLDATGIDVAPAAIAIARDEGPGPRPQRPVHNLKQRQRSSDQGFATVDPVVQHANHFARIEAFPIRLTAAPG